MLQLLYQAPLVPLAPPASCAAAVAKDESMPLSWCTLLMSTLGLFKVRAAGERCSDQGGGGSVLAFIDELFVGGLGRFEVGRCASVEVF